MHHSPIICKHYSQCCIIHLYTSHNNLLHVYHLLITLYNKFNITLSFRSLNFLDPEVPPVCLIKKLFCLIKSITKFLSVSTAINRLLVMMQDNMMERKILLFSSRPTNSVDVNDATSASVNGGISFKTLLLVSSSKCCNTVTR